VCTHKHAHASWDTAGQEQFRCISKAYFRGASGSVLAFDLSSKESFDNTRTWLEEVLREVLSRPPPAVQSPLAGQLTHKFMGAGDTRPQGVPGGPQRRPDPGTCTLPVPRRERERERKREREAAERREQREKSSERIISDNDMTRALSYVMAQHAIDKGEARKMADELKAEYWEVSAKKGAASSSCSRTSIL
jgi:hypothetical protein